MDTPVKVFIGSGEQSRLERKTLMYSLRKHTRRELDIHVFNGTHNAIEHDGDDPRPAMLPLQLKYRNVTEFSLYRFLIPEICGYQGRAIYLDSDTVCLADIGELCDTVMGAQDFLATPAYGPDRWGLSVMLIDCARCHFDLAAIFRDIDSGACAYGDFMEMSPAFLRRRPYSIGKLDAGWNVFDHCDASTRLIHYTDLNRQPWKFHGHPFGHVWLRHLREALAIGAISMRDIELTVLRGYARQDLAADVARAEPAGLRGRMRSVLERLKPR